MAPRMPLAACFLLVASMLCPCTAFFFYQPRVPNAGDRARSVNSNVPAPYGQVGMFCESVGHVFSCNGPPSQGGNPFGRAFHANGGIWNDTICMEDSDGDGMSNADELGDPNCTFTAGSIPYRVTNISHPGFPCSTVADPFCLQNPVVQTTAPPVMTTAAASLLVPAGLLLTVLLAVGALLQ